MNKTQERAVDIIEKLNDMDIDWVDILIPLIYNDNDVAEYFIYNYDDIAYGDY